MTNVEYMNNESKKFFINSLKEHQNLFDMLDCLEIDLNLVSYHLVDAFINNRKLLICGNGGSAADSQHIAAEMVGRFSHNRRPLPAISLTTDTSSLTCIANDFSFEDVFSRQVEAIGLAGDILLAISTSGDSFNVLKAVDIAKSKGMLTVGLLGKDGGIIGGHVDLKIIVPSNSTARIQEAHIFLAHVLCGQVEKMLGLA